MERKYALFFSAVIAGILSWLISSFHLFGIAASSIQFIGFLYFLEELFLRPGPAGSIAVIVLWVLIWIIFWSLFKLRALNLETKSLKEVSLLIKKIPYNQQLNYIYSYFSGFFQNKPGAAETRFSKRISLFWGRLSDHNRSERISFLFSGQSFLDASNNENSFQPVRALIWALPGLGFIGTAFEMANAVKGMGTSLSGTAKYEELQKLLSLEVIPHLGGAFDVTMFALACSIFCFFLITLIHSRSEKNLRLIDTLVLELISKIQDDLPNSLPLDEKINDLNKNIGELKLVIDSFQSGLKATSLELSNLNTIFQKIVSALKTAF